MIGTTLGPYEILAKLGEGGMGEVYRARDARLDREVAIKVLPAGRSGDKEAEARFDREARAIAALSHPNICAIYDVGNQQGRSFLVMELLVGETMDARLRRGPFEWPALVEHAITLADALDTAHGRGLLHRDLKPANIFLTSRGQVKILDFGLAKIMETPNDATRVANGVTGAGTAVGTVGYMSPEQLRGEPIDARSDVFSLGVVLYEMATGARPFAGSTNAAISGAILHQDPATPHTHRADIPAKLEEAILKALEKDRDVRCQSAAELRADLRRVKRAAEPQPAARASAAQASGPPPTPAEPSSRASHVQPATSSDTQVVVGLAKRHPIALVAGVAALGVAIAGVVWFARGPSKAPDTVRISTAAVQIDPLTVSGNSGLGALSPDGRFVAYVRAAEEGWSIWVRQLATQSDVQIAPPVRGRIFIGLTVTADGNYVDAVFRDEGRTSALWRVPLLGGAPRRIISDVWSAVGWAPDGKHFAFIRGTSGGQDTSVILADSEGGSERVLSTRHLPVRFVGNHTSTSIIGRPSWTPDGSIMLVLGDNVSPERRGHANEFVLIDATTGAERKTAPFDHSLYDAALLDASHALVNHAQNNGRVDMISVVDLETGKSTSVTSNLTEFKGITLTVDRTSAVSMRLDARSAIMTGDAAAASLSIVVPESAATPHDVAIDNRGGVVYVSQNGSGQALYSMRAGQAAPTLIADNGSYPRVTGDGETVVFARSGVWRGRVDGSGMTQLAESPAAYPVITPDEQTVLYLKRTDGVVTLWAVPMAGGPGRELLHRFVGSSSLSVSPNGRQLFFSSNVVNGHNAKLVCDLPGCTNVHELPVAVSGLWTPDGRGLAFRDGTHLSMNILIQSIEGGPAKLLTHFTEKAVADFAWSPDFKRLALTRGTQSADMVLLRGFY